ncbi:Nif3-like dinuclear metal center hexameric protein [Conexibacter sp. SYSU D00693]|uniref:Nif3-like dinuclear metal center hexameric protein n=1 Tax=Conexibacter sp. SYSU D00693 TaxID=2812560 RepID=UPI00196B9A34|nr:Nif3-like dinuclear metal center hexameric protein [Conexibacter sp. SYSU D00693]
MADLQTVIAHLDELLESGAFSDYGPNGLQVPAREGKQVRTVVTGVSAHGPLVERAAAEGADLVVVHHGLFWRGQPLEVTPAMHRRLAPLLINDIALAAYHLPLDAHPEHGNNALLADALGLDGRAPFAAHGGRPLGVHGRLPGDGLGVQELLARVQEVCDHDVLHVPGGPDRVHTLGVVSGGASDDVFEAIELGLDAFLTGEPAERAYGAAVDGGIHFLAAGHHATETFGVRRLGELLEAEFGVRHVHVDIRNPI